jgi:hypothetical protein
MVALQYMKRFFIYSSVGAAILIVCIFGFSFWLVTTSGTQAASQRDTIVANGDPLYFTEFARDSIRDDENACHYVMLAKADLTALHRDYAAFNDFDPLCRMTYNQVEEIVRIVNRYPRLYELLEQAAACPGFDSKTDVSLGLAAEFAHIPYFRSAAEAIELKALALAYDGAGDQGLHQCELLLQLNAHLETEPFLVGYLQSIHNQSVVMRTANHILRMTQTSADARARLDRALSAIDNRQACIAALKAERALGVTTFEQFRHGRLDPEMLGASENLKVISWTWLGKAYLNYDEARYLELLDRHIQAAAADAATRHAMVDPIRSEIKADGLRHIVTALLVPVFDAVHVARDRAETYRRALRLLLVLHDHNKLELDDLELEAVMMLDPTTDEPMVVRRTIAGWLIYGVGHNRRDDDGDIVSTDRLPLDIGLGPLGEPLVVADDENIDHQEVNRPDEFE